MHSSERALQVQAQLNQQLALSAQQRWLLNEVTHHQLPDQGLPDLKLKWPRIYLSQKRSVLCLMADHILLSQRRPRAPPLGVVGLPAQVHLAIAGLRAQM